MRKRYPLNVVCRALNVNKSSYYYWINRKIKKEEERIEFYQAVILIYNKLNGVYGAPKIKQELNKQGMKSSVSKVSRAMELLGLKSIVSKRFPKKINTITEKEKSLIVNLIKGLKVDHLNQVWTMDITYIKTIEEGTFYLISYIDYYSKEVVAWGLCDNQRTDEIIKVLKKGIKKEKPNPGLIVHSDKGSQMRSKLYRKFLKDNRIIYSYTSLHHSCDENAAQESFHALLKKESLYQCKMYTYEDAQREIFNYIEGFYNPIRIHSSLGYMSPIAFKNTKLNKNPC